MLFVEALTAFLLAVLIGSLLEYWVHRLMHLRWVLGRKHAEHHRDGWGQGFLGEFFDYTLPIVPVLWVGFLYSVPAGIGFLAGAVFFAVFAAYSHQLQHERPELVFWLPRPVHYLHHRHHMWRHNFGISLDIWDRVFGTYRAEEWKPARRPFQPPLADFLRISWYGQSGPLPGALEEPAREEPLLRGGS
jgi:sterol desaturase/sphingolipid hydroxylase (fatty acid hydroxylase superfamily)